MNKNKEISSSFSIQNLVRKTILNMKSYSSARDEFKEFETNMVFLDANENPFSNGYNRYPDPQQKAVKRVLSKLKGINEKQMLLGNGSDEVLDLIFRAFCEPNKDSIITLPPTYGMYEVSASINNVGVVKIPLDARFQLQTDLILTQKAKMIFLMD